MVKTVKNVFLVIGILVLAFLLWEIFFNDSGVLVTSWNAVAGVINTTWSTITGDSSAIIPEWNIDSDGQNLGDMHTNF